MKRLLASTTAFFALSLVTGCKSNDKAKELILSETQEAKIGLSDTVTTLDPRKARGLSTSNIVQLLFEGLTRVDEKGAVLPGMAENIHISPDLRSYTFQIRPCSWSTGEPVRAADFEYSWKSQLKAHMKAPAHYMLFAIKGAKKAYEGKASLDEVGIKAVDDKTLVVTLENPTPYFLQLTATHPYFPVNQQWDEAHPGWDVDGQKACSSNGPFALDTWKEHEAISMQKNPQYWAQDSIRLTKVDFPIVDDFASTTLFEERALDWVGAPLSQITSDGVEIFKKENSLKQAPAAGIQFLRVNVEKGPLANATLRKAFSLAVDRQAIINDVMQGDQKPACSFVPPALGLTPKEYFAPQDLHMARTLFEEALSQMEMTRDSLPQISLTYISSEKTDKLAQALQQNWKDAFDIDVALDGRDTGNFYDAVFAKKYMLATGSWFADYFDPMSFLSVFQYKENGTNNTEWANAQFTRLLEESCLEINPQKRLTLLEQAHDILMDEMPIMPLFFYSFNFAKSGNLEGAHVSPVGLIQLNQACMVKGPTQQP